MTPSSPHRRKSLAGLASLLAAVCVASSACPAGGSAGGSGELGSVRDALNRGRYLVAKQQLAPALAASPRDGEAQLLLCRVLYANEEVEHAVSACQAAVNDVSPSSPAALSVAEDWLGRALGQRAAHANPISAYRLAKEVRATFERAVQLDPNNGPAASDLGDFYVQAPSLAGGSVEKAQELAASLLTRFPARAHRLLGLVAEQRKDLQGADREFHQEMAAGAIADGNIDFALFLQRENDRDRAVAAVREAMAADTKHGPVQVDAASILISMKREPGLAEQALRSYLASSSQTDEAPVPKAEVMLGKLLESHGDNSGARAAYSAALALAPDFEPAQKALGWL